MRITIIAGALSAVMLGVTQGCAIWEEAKAYKEQVDVMLDGGAPMVEQPEDYDDVLGQRNELQRMVVAERANVFVLEGALQERQELLDQEIAEHNATMADRDRLKAELNAARQQLVDATEVARKLGPLLIELLPLGEDERLQRIEQVLGIAPAEGESP